VFFACGACQVLAHVVCSTYGHAGLRPYWIRPAEGFRGNHIIASDGEWAFDYHGWSRLERLLDHISRKAQRWWPGWSYTIRPLDDPSILISEERSKAMGLHLREPRQFLLDATPRAIAFLQARPAPDRRGAEVGFRAIADCQLSSQERLEERFRPAPGP
jgi:hypothetical protein